LMTLKIRPMETTEMAIMLIDITDDSI